MRFDYDKTTDSLYIELSEKPSVESEEIRTDFIVDFGANGEIVGFDVQHASKTLPGFETLFYSGFLPTIQPGPSREFISTQTSLNDPSGGSGLNH